MLDPSGKAAFVTGAASGIGLGIACRLAEAGARVALADIRAEPLEAARAEVAKFGGETLAIVTDVSDQASVDAAADQIEREWGDVQIVVNNAGVAMHGKPLEAFTDADWNWVIGVNVYGVIHGIRTFVPRLRAHGKASHIVNTASIGGLQVNPTFLTGPYSTTKFAVVALSEALGNELKETDIGVSVLCPMSVATDIHLSERSRPDRLGGPTERPEQHFMGDLIKQGLSPDFVGQYVVEAIRSGQFFILTHPETREWIERRHSRILQGYDWADGIGAKIGAWPVASANKENA
jgi:NAD(P)-dependent dehydrogenase (short-subunit alcohol dehydrogenase family)